LRTSRTKRVTLADVAAKAGVSVATASVAITGRRSGNCRVSIAVADKIKQAAHELNYRPNLQARNLSTQRTHTVAILIKRAAWHNAMFYVPDIQKVLRQANFAEMCILYPDNELEHERENLDLCVSRRVEGIITWPIIDVHGKANCDLFNQIHQQEQIPIVQLGLAVTGCVSPAVVSDEAQGVADAVRWLHSLGHRRIAHATIPGFDNPEPLNSHREAHLRYQGYRRAMAELRLTELVVASKEPTLTLDAQFEAGLELAGRIVQRDPAKRPTAVIAFNDFLATGLMKGSIHAGISIPQQMSVIGVGKQPFGKMLTPALTSIIPAYEKMAELATQTMLKLIAGEEIPAHTALPPTRADRDSVAPPPPDPH
jgi:LacI family transcriptional regulator